MMLLVRLELEQLHLPWLGFRAIWTSERTEEANTPLIINSRDHSEDYSSKELHRNENHGVAKEIINTWSMSWLDMNSGPCIYFHYDWLLIINCGRFLDFLIPRWIVKAMNELRLSHFYSVHIFIKILEIYRFNSCLLGNHSFLPFCYQYGSVHMHLHYHAE